MRSVVGWQYQRYLGKLKVAGLRISSYLVRSLISLELY